ncbi:hypothetical protein [Methylocella silvestris]|uniref:hypothetical protein n=1 Tax=Methylocella silvestris TaxID=199596 RepID=UPI0011D06D1F|nr:hypothetical protein [Methylocella silvestris]
MNLFKFLNSAQREALAWQLLSVASGAGFTGLLWGGQRVWIVTCGAFLAFTLFLWRMKFRFVYGLIELAFGLFVLWNSADEGRGSLARISALILTLFNCRSSSSRLPAQFTSWSVAWTMFCKDCLRLRETESKAA